MKMQPPPRRWLSLNDFVDTVPVSMSTLRRYIRKQLIEHTQPGGPGTAIYVPEDAFEQLSVPPACDPSSPPTSDQLKSKSTDSGKKLSGPSPKWMNQT